MFIIPQDKRAKVKEIIEIKKAIEGKVDSMQALSTNKDKDVVTMEYSSSQRSILGWWRLKDQWIGLLPEPNELAALLKQSKPMWIQNSGRRQKENVVKYTRWFYEAELYHHITFSTNVASY